MFDSGLAAAGRSFFDAEIYIYAYFRKNYQMSGKNSIQPLRLCKLQNSYFACK
jgi:hypothetical protein